ncbi:MAG: helix-turn-helix domain-containing protein [Clostridiales bacterium]|nr:helix-turn-helix domain-containing protein [Clostridiales bacterium]
MLITRETKLAIVKRHLEDGVTLKELSEEFGIHTSNIKYYLALYLKHGESVFTNSDSVKTYTREYKLKAIKRYINGNESMRAIAVDLGLTDFSVLRDWVVKYRNGGEDAIQTSTGRKNYLLHEERQDKIASDELKERIKYLEAENEYLKKSYSLILERSKQSKKK